MNSFERNALEFHVSQHESVPPGITKILGDVIEDNDKQAQRIAELSAQIAELTRQRDAYRSQCFEYQRRQRRIDSASELSEHALIKNQGN